MAYIEKEPIIEFIIKGLNNPDKSEAYGYDAVEILSEIEYTPIADVVEVVRCKDCKHYKPYTKPVEDFDGECIVRECETDENEFCSYGTSKERGGEK